MIDKLIEHSVKNSSVAFICAAMLIAFGWISFQSLPIDAVPDITNVQVQVNTSVEGLVPEEIEKLVTFPIESQISGIPGILQVRSITRFGLSQITVVFEEGTDIYIARQLVTEKIQGVRNELPPGTNTKLGPITTGLGEIYFYGLEAKEKAEGNARLEQLMELRTINEWVIKPRLLALKGVAEVNSIGGYEKQYFVEPDIQLLSSYGIHLHDLVEAIEKNNRNTGGGYLKQTSEQLLVQATGLIKSIEDIENIGVIRLPNLRNIMVKDVAEVKLARELRTGAALVNGEEIVLGTILMMLGDNSRTVSLAVDAEIQSIQQSLPAWVNLETLYTRSELVDRTLITVEKNLIFGAILVAIVLLIMLGSFRIALITAITIPLSLLATFIWMRIFGVSGNLMSLGALDFGIIIDGAVIVMDNCARQLRTRAHDIGRDLTRDEIKDEVIVATKEIRSAAGFGQLIIIIVFLPIFALTGVEAKMFSPMAAAFCFALGSAFILSFSVVPAMAGSFLQGKVSRKKPWIMTLFERGYAPIIHLALKMKAAVIIFGLAAGGAGIYLYYNLGADFLPKLDEGSIAIQFVRPTNISIDQSIEMQKLSERLILEFPEVKTVLSRIGTSEVATDPMGVNLSDTYVLLHPSENLDKHELVEHLKEKLELHIPGQSLIFSQPIQLRFNELLEGVRADVSFKVFGDDSDVISDLTAQAAAIIAEIPGVGEAEEEIKSKSPVLRIKPDMTQLQLLGIPKENVLTTVETALGGTEAGSLYEGVMRFPIIIRLSEESRSDLGTVRSLPVGIGHNLTAPMSEVAEISFEETHGEIKRENFRKRGAVLINVRGRDTLSFVQEAQAKVSDALELPPGYYVQWGGSFKNLETAKDRLVFVVPLALLLVFMMIYFAFSSVLQTCIIFLCIPMALVGGVLGLMGNGLDFSISAAIGFIALSGIAVLNGVVLVSYFNRLRDKGVTGDDLIKQGTMMRLRPVLMTALTDIFGFLPMMLATGAGAEVQRPLASVVVGGITSATILTLIILPVLYRLTLPALKNVKF